MKDNKIPCERKPQNSIQRLLSFILKNIPDYQENQLNKWEKKWE